MRSALPLLLLPLLTLAHAADAPPPDASTSAATTAAETTPGPGSATPAAAAVQPAPFVYMVSRVKLTGTDLTQVVFFAHKAITTLEDCETERTAGLTTGWNHFNRFYLRTLKGISYKVDYRCVSSEQQFLPLREGVPHDNFYLVRTRDNQLKVTPYRNFFACRDALRQVSATEDIDTFCAISAQAIVENKAN